MMIVIVKRSDSRERMLGSAVQLLREQGYTGTGFRDLIDHSGAPRGSIYHHFQGGKTQLAEEATRWAGDFIKIGSITRSERLAKYNRLLEIESETKLPLAPVSRPR